MQLAHNINASWVFVSGLDHSGIGWWVWNQFQGKSGRIIRFYTFYRLPDNYRDFGTNIN